MQKFYLFILQFVPLLCFTQSLSYIHYDTKDGLAGSTVYDICQDKEGFLWFATESGLSRFDGKNFTNFTVEDGLPDNEILRVFADTRGRVWIMPFKKAICYYYRSKIYNSENDLILNQIVPESNIFQIAEDEDGNIIISDSKKVILIGQNNSVKEIFRPNEYPPHKEIAISIRKNYFDKGFIVRINDSVFNYKDNSLIFSHTDSIIYDRTIVQLITYPKGQKYLLKIPYNYINYETKANYVTFINTYNGCWATDTTERKITQHFLPGKKISKTLEDNEGNLWFSTLGDGIYKLASKESKTIDFAKGKDISNPEIFSLEKFNDKLLCGLGFSKAVLLDKTKITEVFNFEKQTLSSINSYPPNRLYCIKTLTTGIILLGFDSYLVKITGNRPVFINIFPIKSIDEINDQFALIGTSNYVFKIRVKDMQIADTIWEGRCTKLLFSQRKYYIGTLNGLYEVYSDKSYKHLGLYYPIFKARITDIKSGPGQTLYVATADKGVGVYQNGELITTFTDKNGLSSNICRTLYLQNNFLFIGTNKGLNKIDISKKNYPVIKYSTSDGLPSDVINAIYAEDSIVWIGSPSGLTYFNEKRISSTSACNIVLLNVLVSGKEVDLSKNHRLSYASNNITFEYAGISLKSEGNIEYYYKLVGLDKEWNRIRQASLIYKSLPPGNYKFQIYAVNKFGMKSKNIEMAFIVQNPFWRNWWFFGVLFFITISLTAWLANKISKRVHAAREERNKIQHQFAALEQQALQAQMNPHFVFNCLNSIQQYILTNNKEKANQYLTGFASLIRQTLDNSEKRTITLADEIAYLSKYLEMEKMRFADNFNYEIGITETIKAESIEIPALLLQPFVENCLRHGIRYKEHGTGKVDILFSLGDNVLHCRIKDNGVGREKAAELKSQQHIEYQSRGVKLTEKRIELLNKINHAGIEIEILDQKNDAGNAAGTEVIIKIPLQKYG